MKDHNLHRTLRKAIGTIAGLLLIVAAIMPPTKGQDRLQTQTQDQLQTQAQQRERIRRLEAAAGSGS